VSPTRVIEILRRCDQRGWSLAELARRAKIRPNTLSSIVNGHTTPQRRTLVKIADALGTTAEVLATADERRARRDDSDADVLATAFGEIDPVGQAAVLAFATALADGATVAEAIVAARAAETIERRRAEAASTARSAESAAAATGSIAADAEAAIRRARERRGAGRGSAPRRRARSTG